MKPRRYIPLTINGTTYHPEVQRAAKLLRWMSAGFIITRVEDTRKLVSNFGW